MRSIAIMNQKGGVGKTTSTVNISAALAAAGKRVCVIDLDPQAHATLHLGVDLDSQEEAQSIYDVLTGKCKIADVRQQVGENLWLVPAHLDLVGADMVLAGAIGRELILRNKLAEDNFPVDYLLIDCPPSLGICSLNALAAVQDVFVPLQPHYFSLHGFTKLVETLEALKQFNHSLRLSGILLCMFDRTRLAGEVSQDVDVFFGQRDKLPAMCRDAVVFETKIRRNIQLAEAPSHGRPIFEYDPNSNGAEDYRNLAAEIIEKFGAGRNEKIL